MAPLAKAARRRAERGKVALALAPTDGRRYNRRVMSATVRLLVVAILLVAGVPARADFLAGVAAYKRGDYKAAYEEWLPPATDGFAKAQFNIGILYYGGEGVSTDFHMAQLWFRKAAAQGHAEAQFNLANMMEFAEGPVGSERQIVELYRKSAEQGYASAQYNLGMMYLEGGFGIRKSATTAAEWFEKAAMQGDLEAQYMTARVNVILDDAKVWAWMRILEERGDSDAQKLRDFIEPRIVDINREEGEELYQKLRKNAIPRN